MIALPGSTVYARNHGVYLTDSQVVSLGQQCGLLSRPGMATWSCALGSLLSWTSWAVWIRRRFPCGSSSCAHLVFC